MEILPQKQSYRADLARDKQHLRVGVQKTGILDLAAQEAYDYLL